MNRNIKAVLLAAVKPEPEPVLVELRRMAGDRWQVASLVADLEHAHGERRQEIGLGQRVAEAAPIADLLVPDDNRGAGGAST